MKEDNFGRNFERNKSEDNVHINLNIFTSY